MTADRIAVIGISGSGKSTFARELAARTGLPLFHGDQLEWTRGWRERAPDDLEAMHKEWLDQPCWIIEGWIEPDRAERLQAADLVIDLDVSRWRCLWRLARRMHSWQRRPEMPEDCVDRPSAWRLAVAFLKLERPTIDAALRAVPAKAYVRLSSPRAVRRWLETFDCR